MAKFKLKWAFLQQDELALMRVTLISASFYFPQPVQRQEKSFQIEPSLFKGKFDSRTSLYFLLTIWRFPLVVDARGCIRATLRGLKRCQIHRNSKIESRNHKGVESPSRFLPRRWWEGRAALLHFKCIDTQACALETGSCIVWGWIMQGSCSLFIKRAARRKKSVDILIRRRPEDLLCLRLSRRLARPINLLWCLRLLA